MKPLLAFHGNDATKRKYLDRVKAHRKADELIHDIYWQNGKGCAVGCTVHSASHFDYESELGIPSHLARLEDIIFERLKNGEAQKWPEQFLSAPRVGADLSMVWPRFALWLLADKRGPVHKAANGRKNVAEAVAGVADLYARWIKIGTNPKRAKWKAARSAAAAAYAAAAGAAAYAAYAAYAAAGAACVAAAAAYAAYAAADDADDAAAYATAGAACVAAAAAADDSCDTYAAYARSRFWISARDKLLQLMRAAPVRKKSEGREWTSIRRS